MRRQLIGRGTTTPKELHGFKVGDRVRLSELGRSRSWRMPDVAGKVIGFSGRATSVKVIFKGRTTPTTLHVSYLVPATE
jgi:hypothetical protein